MSKKKFLSVVLAASMITSIAAVSAVSASAADTRGTLYFDNTGALEGAQRNTYYCYTWGSEGGALYEWGTKETKMTKVSDNIFSFDVPKVNSAGDPVNADLVIFSGLGKGQTYDTTFSDSCFGDTAYVLDELLENPVDSAQTCYACAWRNNPQEGAHISITSTGKVQGIGILSNETPESITDAFIEQYKAGMEEGKVGYDNPALVTDEARQGYIDEINRIISERPTVDPSELPTQAPTTDAPTEAPTTAPTEVPTEAPTGEPQHDDPYGRIPGLPLPADVNVPAKDANPSATYDGWDGYYNVYYFAAPSEWISEHADAKNKGTDGKAWDLGFYWYTGAINNGDWPGVAAKKLEGATVNVDGKDLQVYYGFAPTFAESIIWNNGISDAVAENKKFKLQTEDIKVGDPALNSLADIVYEESGYAIDGVSVAGCLSYVSEIEHTVNGLTGDEMDVYKCKWHFYNPRTGETTDTALKNENGEYVTTSGEAYGYDYLALNPYFDMDYDHVNQGEIPTEVPPATLPPAPDPTQKATDKATDATKAQATSAASTTSGKVVDTSDSATVAVFAVVMLAACSVVVAVRKKREM